MTTETDPFFDLLTDALRRGPGSPEWREAVARIRAGKVGGENDELKLLVLTRENLAAGQAYRSVRAGPEFTRELNAKLDESADGGSTISRSSSLVLALSGAALLVVIGAVVWFAFFRSTAQQTGSPVDALKAVYFVKPLADIDFASAASVDTLRSFGTLDVTRGPLPRIDGRADYSEPTGSVFYLPRPLDLAGSVSAELTLDLRRPSDNVIAQLALAPAPQFAGPTAASPGEFVVLVQGQTAKVLLPDGRVVIDVAVNGETTLRIRAGATHAVVDVDNVSVWAGPHGLTSTTPVAAVRLVRVGKEAGDVRVRSLRVTTP